MLFVSSIGHKIQEQTKAFCCAKNWKGFVVIKGQAHFRRQTGETLTLTLTPTLTLTLTLTLNLTLTATLTLTLTTLT
jgi:hypothetical protein